MTEPTSPTYGAEHTIHMPRRGSQHYSHSVPYTNGDAWNACGLREFLRRVAECDMGCTVRGTVNGRTVILRRVPERLGMLWVHGDEYELRGATGWGDVVAQVGEVLGR